MYGWLYTGVAAAVLTVVAVGVVLRRKIVALFKKIFNRNH